MIYILSAMYEIAQTYKNVDFEKIIKTYEEKLEDLRGCLWPWKIKNPTNKDWRKASK